jgi:predicted metal-dependent hydrolase
MSFTSEQMTHISKGETFTDEKNRVPIRHLQFDFDPDKASLYCHKNNDFSSAFILTFSTLIPHGERLVIDAVRAYRDKIKDPELKARVNGLIGQEAMHSKIHEEFNAMYEAKGLPIKAIDKMGYWYFIKFLQGVLPLSWQLGVTCAIEHTTALMAEKAFSELSESMEAGQGDPKEGDLDPITGDFLTWHLLEELEHKSVAFDLYQEQVGSHWLRVASFLFFNITVGPLGVLSIRKIMKTPGYKQKGNANKEGKQFWFGKGGYFDSLRPKIYAYLKADFHPDNVDTTEMLERWGNYYLGEEGELRANITKIVEPKVA